MRTLELTEYDDLIFVNGVPFKPMTGGRFMFSVVRLDLYSSEIRFHHIHSTQYLKRKVNLFEPLAVSGTGRYPYPEEWTTLMNSNWEIHEEYAFRDMHDEEFFKMIRDTPYPVLKVVGDNPYEYLDTDDK